MDESVVKRLKKVLTDRFAMNSMGKVILVLGMNVIHDDDKGDVPITQEGLRPHHPGEARDGKPCVLTVI